MYVYVYMYAHDIFAPIYASAFFDDVEVVFLTLK